MHLTRIRYFIAIAEEQNVGRAARRLRVAQPALSRQLKALEDEVGVPLVDRSARGVRLTQAGTAFLEHARRAVGDVEAGVREARAAACAAAATTLRVCPPDWPHRAQRVAVALTALRERCPDVAVAYDTTPWLVHAAALANGELDVGFGVAMSPEDYGAGIMATRLVDEPASAALLPMGHPLGMRASLKLSELRDLPTLVPPRAVVPVLHDQMVGTIRRGGYEPRVLPSPLSFAAAAQHVVAGAGWIITVLSVGEMPPPGTVVVPIEDASVMLGFFVLTRADDARGPVRSFVECLREEFGKARRG